MKVLKKILNLTEKTLEIISMFFLVAMTLIIGYQIFMRYFFSNTPKWSEELSLVLMVWFAFMGMAIGVNKGIHLSIEYFVDKLSEKGKKIVAIINNILVTLFGFVLLISGYSLAKMAGMSIMPALQVPTTVLYAVVPICGFMIIVSSINSIIELFSGEEKVVGSRGEEIIKTSIEGGEK